MEIIEAGYTRVSDILSIFQAYTHVNRKVLKRAQDIGTEVHAAIENYFIGGFDPLRYQLRGYFDSFLEFVATFRPKPLCLERRFYDNKLMITGRIDLLADINGKTVLIDWKTGSMAHPPIWRLQGSFYRGLIQGARPEEDTSIPLPDQFIFVQLDKDGGAPIPHVFEYDSKDYSTCMAALDCYRHFKQFDLNCPAEL